MNKPVEHSLTRATRRSAAALLIVLLAGGCSGDLASLINPELNSLPVDNPLAEAVGGSSAPSLVENATFIGSAPSSSALSTQQVDADNPNEAAAKRFVDGITNSIMVQPCNWTFNQSAALHYATHCGMVAQDETVEDLPTDSIKELNLLNGIKTVETEITLDPTFTVTFKQGVNAPDELYLDTVSIAASVRDEQGSPPSQVYITSLAGMVLDKSKSVDANTFEYVMKNGQYTTKLTNRPLWIEFPGPGDAIDVLTTEPNINKVDVAALISIYIIRNNVPVDPHNIVDADFSIQLGDKMTLSAGNE